MFSLFLFWNRLLFLCQKYKKRSCKNNVGRMKSGVEKKNFHHPHLFWTPLLLKTRDYVNNKIFSCFHLTGTSLFLTDISPASKSRLHTARNRGFLFPCHRLMPCLDWFVLFLVLSFLFILVLIIFFSSYLHFVSHLSFVSSLSAVFPFFFVFFLV